MSHYTKAVEQLKGFTKGALLLNDHPRDPIPMRKLTDEIWGYSVEDRLLSAISGKVFTLLPSAPVMYWESSHGCNLSSDASYPVMFLDWQRTIEPGGIVYDNEYNITSVIHRFEGYNLIVLSHSSLWEIEWTRVPVIVRGDLIDDLDHLPHNTLSPEEVAAKDRTLPIKRANLSNEL